MQDGLRTAVSGARDAREFWTRGFAGGDAAAEGDAARAHARHRPMFSVRLVASTVVPRSELPLEAAGSDVALAIFDDAIDMFKGFQCVRDKVMQQEGCAGPERRRRRRRRRRAEIDEFDSETHRPDQRATAVRSRRAAIAVLEENFSLAEGARGALCRVRGADGETRERESAGGGGAERDRLGGERGCRRQAELGGRRIDLRNRTRAGPSRETPGESPSPSRPSRPG